jgi:hypothetical protein
MKKRLPTMNELKQLSDYLISNDTPKDVVDELMDDGFFIVAENYIITNDLFGIEGCYAQVQTVAKIIIAIWNLKSIEIYRIDGKISPLKLGSD